ncbi:hypothetical protein THRCLA_10747, partial [Thraustotheca clavata]
MPCSNLQSIVNNMSSNNLFTPLNVGRLTLNNRIIMPPLTRCRATPDDHIPSELMIQHYADRADAGLLIAECSMITPSTSAFYSEPGVYSKDQLAAWKKITDAVHAKGGKIFCQIWHAGRAAHPDLNRGAETVSASAIAIDGLVHGPNGKVQHVVPRELTVNEISDIVELFATAAKNCVEVAGFDGVELHSANGYLIDQFLKDSSNHRTDNYGGSFENRARFLFEILTAVSDAIGSDHVGTRLSPINTYNSQSDSDPEALAQFLATQLNSFNLAYVHILRHDELGVRTEDYLPVYRKYYHGVLIGNGKYTREEADEAIESGAVDAVAFGKAFVSNPDLVKRFERHAALNEADHSTFFIQSPRGYNDYPTSHFQINLHSTMSAANLFTPIQVGRYLLKNRILMAPLTRARATPGDHIPSDMMVQHYSDRASSGLIITECSMITPLTSAFYSEPGVYSTEQLAAWKKVTDAVHAKGGKIFCQIWHAGRATHPDLNGGAEPVAPSPIAIDGTVHGPNGKVPYVTPRELTVNEIADIVELFATAAKNCIEVAGFDGVEIHGANGYLIDQFLKDSSNHRTDNYGGSRDNRARFLREVVTAVTNAIGSDRVGIRFSPLNSFNSQKDSDPIELSEYVAGAMNEYNLAYVHVLRADFFGIQTGDVVPVFREHYKGTLIANAGYSKSEAEEAIACGKVDAIAFGTPLLANPDLVERFEKDAPLNSADSSTFYTSGEKGYNDYPFL